MERSTTIPPNIAQRLAAIRKSRGYSQIQIKRDIGINVQRLEAGEYNPQLHTLERLAEYLDINISEFFKED